VCLVSGNFSPLNLGAQPVAQLVRCDAGVVGEQLDSGRLEIRGLGHHGRG
jgi:hypothetical protein